MTAEQIFSICGAVALAGWLVLIFAGRRAWAAPFVSGSLIPLLFAFAYTAILLTHRGTAQGGFGSLAEVSLLFSDPWILLAGWIHYLAFDLFIGSWQVRDSMSNAIPHLAVIPCLVLTFLFGPVGLLLYFIVRAARRRSIMLRAEPLTRELG